MILLMGRKSRIDMKNGAMVLSPEEAEELAKDLLRASEECVDHSHEFCVTVMKSSNDTLEIYVDPHNER